MGPDGTRGPVRHPRCEDGNENLLKVVDSWLERRTDRSIPLDSSITTNARAYIIISANKDNSCVPHAIQMALELLGFMDESAKLPDIWADYLLPATDLNVRLNNRTLRVEGIACRGSLRISFLKTSPSATNALVGSSPFFS